MTEAKALAEYLHRRETLFAELAALPDLFQDFPRNEDHDDPMDGPRAGDAAALWVHIERMQALADQFDLGCETEDRELKIYERVKAAREAAKRSGRRYMRKLLADAAERDAAAKSD